MSQVELIDAPAMSVPLRPVAELAPYAENSRTHSPEQIAQLEQAILEFGFTIPVLADAVSIAAGHARVEAVTNIYARGQTIRLPDGTPIPAGLIPTMDCTGWSAEQKRAYVIADNRLAEISGWDEDILRSELAALSGADFDLSFLGFNDGELESLLAVHEPEPEPEPAGSQEPHAMGSLAARFGIAPFSVLNAREGWWQDRKRAWLGLGIRSEVGRGENLIGRSLHELVALALSGGGMTSHYSASKAFIEERRAAGMSDQDILAAAGADNLASKQAGKSRSFGQDMLNGEGIEPQRGLSNRGTATKHARPGGGGGGAKSVWLGKTDGGSAPIGDGAVNAKGASGAATSSGLTYGAMKSNPGHPRGDLPFAGPKAQAIGGADWIRAKQATGEIGSGLAGETPGNGTSIFDPVLCELAYRWWSPPEGLVLDPFAGGSVRGIVAVKTGRRYMGVDLRAEQVIANEAQAEAICGDGLKPEWTCGDSRNIPDLLPGLEADFLFSCPPYADLEVYSDDPQDLSTLEYAEFREAYFEIIAKAAAHLKEDRFACFVVGDVRDPKGNYRGFVRDTELAFEAAGLRFYNEAILVTACGSLALRAGKQFAATRKLGKTHQNVLVFVKGDARKATAACGIPDFGEVGDEPDEDAGDVPGVVGPALDGADLDDSAFGEAL